MNFIAQSYSQSIKFDLLQYGMHKLVISYVWLIKNKRLYLIY